MTSRPPLSLPEHSPSWHAELHLGFASHGERTALRENRHCGPLRVQKALYPEGDSVCQAILLHPPSGIAGGDHLAISATIEAGAHAQLTTPGAGKWYRSGGAEASQTINFSLAEGATLEWLPQETIFFDGARARLETRVLLAADSRFIGWDILCLGRAAAGERFTNVDRARRIRRQRSDAGQSFRLGRRHGVRIAALHLSRTVPAGSRPARSAARHHARRRRCTWRYGLARPACRALPG
jgi:urease accessory protein